MVKFIKFLLKLPETVADLGVTIDELKEEVKCLKSQNKALEQKVAECSRDITTFKTANEQEAEAREIMNEYFFGEKGDYR